MSHAVTPLLHKFTIRRGAINATTLGSLAALSLAAKSRPPKPEIGNSNAMMARHAQTVQLPDAWPGLSKNGYNAYGGNNVTHNDNSKSNATTIAMIALATITAMRCWQDKRASKTSKRASKGRGAFKRRRCSCPREGAVAPAATPQHPNKHNAHMT